MIGKNEPGTTGDAKQLDSVLYAAVIAKIAALEMVGRELRFDARPLEPDAALVTLHSMKVVPEYVDTVAQERPLANVDSSVIRSRKNVLETRRYRETDAFRDARCPGVMLLAEPERKRDCPKGDVQYVSVIIALPRAGGPYWPNNLDQRHAYASEGIFSMRVIERTLSEHGSVESSADYVFECNGSRGWKFLKKVDLLIVE